MQSVVQMNIDKFHRPLATEADPTKRSLLLRLLAEDETDKAKGSPPSACAGEIDRKLNEDDG